MTNEKIKDGLINVIHKYQEDCLKMKYNKVQIGRNCRIIEDFINIFIDDIVKVFKESTNE